MAFTTIKNNDLKKYKNSNVLLDEQHFVKLL